MIKESLKVEINRLFVKKINGETKFFASIRDYIVEKAKKENKNLIVFCKELNEDIIIPAESLNEGIKSNDVFKSKIDGKPYSLIDFEWDKYKRQDLGNPRTFSRLIL
jgi:hypothetical protein